MTTTTSGPQPQIQTPERSMAALPMPNGYVQNGPETKVDTSGAIVPHNSPDNSPAGDATDDNNAHDSHNSGCDKMEKIPHHIIWYRHLKKIVMDAKGAASEAVLSFIKSNLNDTKLIFVVGQTGKGKSTLLKELTGLELKIGSTMESDLNLQFRGQVITLRCEGTLKYHVCPAVVDGQQYLFIDTAGFGATDIDDMANMDDIRSCLVTLGSFLTVAGVLLVYGRPGDKLTAADTMTLRWVQCFCGPAFFQNITIVTSKWDELKQKPFNNYCVKVDQLTQGVDVALVLDPPERFHGGAWYHHGLPGGNLSADAYPQVLDYESEEEQRAEELRNLIRRRYASNPRSLPVLQFAAEIASGLPWEETEAAKVLTNNVCKSKIQIRDGRAVVVPTDTTNVELKSEPSPSAKDSSPKPAQEHKTEVNPNTGTPPADGSAKPKPAQKPTPPPPKPDSNKKFFSWLEVAKQVAVYFSLVRKASSKGDTEKKPEWANLWGAFTNWWSGPPPQKS